MIVEAVQDRIILKKLMRTKTQGGLILPDNAILDPQLYGKVESMGPDVKGVEVGDVLCYHQQAARVAVFKSQEYHVVVFGEIYGKVVDEGMISELEESQPLIPNPGAEAPSLITSAI